MAAAAGGGAGAGAKRRAAAPEEDSEALRVRPLGAGQEVGRSCLILKFKGKTIMLDCGVLPAFRGEEALPLLREVDPAAVDIVIITHFHLDHCAALPYFTERMLGFRGRVFATHATKAVMRLILNDFVRVSGNGAVAPAAPSAPGGGAAGVFGGAEDAASAGSAGGGAGRGQDMEADLGLYDEADVARCLARIEPLDLRQRVSVEGVSFSLWNAGHVLGAAMVLLDIAGVRVLYTGDYSHEEDRHLPPAEVPPGARPDVLICESTAGMQVHEARESREKRLLAAVEKVVRRGGRCLLPISALGAAQELMLILEDHWAANPDLAALAPIYLVSHMSEAALDVYRTFLGAMTQRLQRAAVERNPWDLRFVRRVRPSAFRDSGGPCVVLAAPGMLQSGTSRMLFDQWAGDPANGVVLAGYAVEGTLARSLEMHPLEVETLTRRRIARKCLIERVSFHAHADSQQTAAFVDAVAPRSIMLVHGERNEMGRLHEALRRKYRHTPGWHGVYMPTNVDFFTYRVQQAKTARVVGTLAERITAGTPGARVSGVLVSRHFEHLLCAPEDLPRFTALSTHSLSQKLHVPFRSSFALLRAFVAGMFAGTTEGEEDAGSLPAGVPAPRKTLSVLGGLLTLTHSPPDRVVLTWAASPQADLVAESVAAVVAQAEVSQAAIAATHTGRKCAHSHSHGYAGHGHSAGEGEGEGAGETDPSAEGASRGRERAAAAGSASALLCPPAALPADLGWVAAAPWAQRIVGREGALEGAAVAAAGGGGTVAEEERGEDGTPSPSAPTLHSKRRRDVLLHLLRSQYGAVAVRVQERGRTGEDGSSDEEEDDSSAVAAASPLPPGADWGLLVRLDDRLARVCYAGPRGRRAALEAAAAGGDAGTADGTAAPASAAVPAGRGFWVELLVSPSFPAPAASAPSTDAAALRSLAGHAASRAPVTPGERALLQAADGAFTDALRRACLHADGLLRPAVVPRAAPAEADGEWDAGEWEGSPVAGLVPVR